MSLRSRIDKLYQSWINKSIPASHSITLKQNQVYIFPSKFGFLYLVCCAALLLLAINFQNSQVYILCFWMISLFIIVIFKTWLNLVGIHVRAGIVEPVFCGMRAEFPVILESLGHEHRAIWLLTKESITHADCLEKANHTTSLFVTGKQRGRIRLPRFRIETTYPLGILRAWSYIDLDQETLCYPNPLESELPAGVIQNFTDEIEAESDVRISGVENFDGLKTYQMGDSISRISWNAYAKGHGLFIKEFTGQAQSELWLDYDKLPGNVEKRLSNLCFWVLKFNDEKKVFGLKLGAREIVPAQGPAHLAQCLEALALFGM